MKQSVVLLTTTDAEQTFGNGEKAARAYVFSYPFRSAASLVFSGMVFSHAEWVVIRTAGSRSSQQVVLAQPPSVLVTLAVFVRFSAAGEGRGGEAIRGRLRRSAIREGTILRASWRR